MLAAIADCHLGNFPAFGGTIAPDGLNARGALTVDTFTEAARKVPSGVDLFVCGDLFHHKRPEPCVIAGAGRAINELTSLAVLIPGNHDEIDATAEGRNTACEALIHASNAIVPRALTYTAFGAMEGARGIAASLPFDARQPMADFMEAQAFDAPGWLAAETRALCTHVGVVDDDSPPWLRDAKDAIHADRLFRLMERERIDACFVGNYHQHREWRRDGRVIVQIGALNPTGFSDGGLDGYGGLATWYGKDRVEWQSIPGPRFVRLCVGDVQKIPDGCSVFARVDRLVGGGEEYVLGPYAGVEFVDPAPGIVEQIDDHRPDKLLESAEQALVEFADRVALPEGISKQDVIDKVKELWRGAS